MKKYEVTIYRKNYDPNKIPEDMLWDFEWYEKNIEGESIEEVEKYVCSYLRNMEENVDDFYIKIEEHI